MWQSGKILWMSDFWCMAYNTFISFSRVTVTHTHLSEFAKLYDSICLKSSSSENREKKDNVASQHATRLAWHFIIYQDKINNALSFSIKNNLTGALSWYCWVELSIQTHGHQRLIFGFAKVSWSRFSLWESLVEFTTLDGHLI